MSTTKGTRKRAVRLTPEALRLLQDALVEGWQKSGDTGKLTRERRAELLGLSVVTADRLFRGEGVDRPTLILAFSSLGLKWDEAFCAPDATPATQPLPSPPDAPSPPEVRQGQARLWPLVIGAILMFGLMMGSSYRSRASNWVARFNEMVALSERYYHRADYPTARLYLKEAMTLAQKQENVSRLSEAMRLAGDLERVTGNLSEARRYYFDAYRMRRSLQSTRNLASLLTYLGETETDLGLHADAAEHLQEALQRFTTEADLGGVVMVQRALGELAYARGNYVEARRNFDLGLASAKGEAMRIDLLSLRALVQARQGDFRGAREQLDESYAYWSKQNHIRWIARMLLRRAEVELLAGEREQALRLLQESQSSYAQIGDQGGVRECRSLEMDSQPEIASSRSNVHSQ